MKKNENIYCAAVDSRTAVFLFSIQTPTIWEFNSVLSLLSKNVIVHDFIVYVFKIIVFMLKTLKLL